MDQCVFQNLDENDVLDWLKEDFNRYYLQNRAPYLMAFHTSWFQQKAFVTHTQGTQGTEKKSFYSKFR